MPVLDHRQWDPWGIGSMQVVERSNGTVYADVDRFNPYDFPIGTVLHNGIEVIPGEIMNIFRSIF